MNDNYQASPMLVQMEICNEVYDSLTQSNPNTSRKDLSEKLRLSGGEDLNVALTSLGYARRDWEHVPLFERRITFEVERKGKTKMVTTKRGVVLTDLSQDVLRPYCGISVFDSISPSQTLFHLDRTYRYAQALKNGLLAFVAGGGATALFKDGEYTPLTLGVSSALAVATMLLVTRRYSRSSMLARLNIKTGLVGLMLALDVPSSEQTYSLEQ